MTTETQNCESCEVVGIQTPAVTIRNGEHVCQDCADEVDNRKGQEENLREAERLASR